MELKCIEDEAWNSFSLIAEESEVRERLEFDPRKGGRPEDLLDPIIEQNQRPEAKIRALAAEGDDIVRNEYLEAVEWLQTVTIPLSSVKKELEAWRPAVMKEYEALMANGVVRKAKEGEVEHGSTLSSSRMTTFIAEEVRDSSSILHRACPPRSTSHYRRDDHGSILLASLWHLKEGLA